MLALVLASLLAAATAAAVGPAVPYVAREPAPRPVPAVELPPPPPQLSTGQMKQIVQQNARLLALLGAVGITATTLVSCALSSDTCVRRRLNRNRRLAIVATDSPNE